MSCQQSNRFSYITENPQIPVQFSFDQSVCDFPDRLIVYIIVYSNFFSCGFRGKQGRGYSSLAIFVSIALSVRQGLID